MLTIFAERGPWTTQVLLAMDFLSAGTMLVTSGCAFQWYRFFLFEKKACG